MNQNEANAEALDIAIRHIRRQKQIITAQRAVILCAVAVIVILLL